MTFINSRIDFAFKKIFGSKKSKDILISFLNAILYQEREVILDVEILAPYQAPRIQGIKESYLDVKATITDNKTVIIEMQVLNVLGFDKRVLYNAAKAFSIQFAVGEDYTLLNPIIALTITDFEMFEQGDKVISRYRLKEKDDFTDYSDDIELVFVELPKFHKELDDLETLTDKWIYFLKSANRHKTVPPIMDAVPAIHHAFAVAQQSKLTKRELEILEKREMFLQDNRNAILKARLDGEAKGIQKGRAEAELETKRAIARSLLSILDPAIISQTTGLSLAEVNQLSITNE
ncbi:MAG: Rpn family recombination-promoting nuclease/putative transposase [Oculatellaceae cyanobacterium Prado106]|jgi:predicted transposase/invertase (TIGR01784 family)|nr:Rpn family recombination-promoting nuclease/putative transposase [Oculatellaceae cyanobacterium Prado106]